MTASTATEASLHRPAPTILVEGAPLPDNVLAAVNRVIIDSHAHLPDMVEIEFFAGPAAVLPGTKLAIGAAVTISAAAPGDKTTAEIITAEVTAIEAEFASTTRTVIRGYSADHRLQRGRRTRAFLNMKLSDIARKVASEAGLTVGAIEQTKTAHDHVGQVNQTDWDFLASRARASGYQIGVVGGKFTLRKAAAAEGKPVPLVFPDSLRSFRPRITAGNAAVEAEVRIWDPMSATVTSSRAPTATGSVTLGCATPEDLAARFAGDGKAPAKSGGAGATGDLGPPPSDQAYVVSDWPLAVGAATGSAAEEAVAGVAEHLGGTFAEAEGEAIGSPALVAGAVADVSGVSATFAGKWVVTRARHVFDQSGYHVRFEVSGSQERSLLGLTAGGAAHRGSPLWHGVTCGVVTNNNDPDKKGRVKLTLPWLSPLYETDWSPVVQPGAGRLSGALFLPEVGDEVLVGFEFGDPQRAYVLGGIVNAHSTYQLGGPPVKVKGATGSVVWRGFVSSSGSKLAFHDELSDPEGRQPPTASDLVLGTGDDKLSLVIDQTGGAVTLTCDPTPPASKASAGALTISCGQAGTINIQTGQGGTVNIDGGAQLNVTAQASVTIESQGVVEIKGAQIKLN